MGIDPLSQGLDAYEESNSGTNEMYDVPLHERDHTDCFWSGEEQVKILEAKLRRLEIEGSSYSDIMAAELSDAHEKISRLEKENREMVGLLTWIAETTHCHNDGDPRSVRIHQIGNYCERCFSKFDCEFSTTRSELE